MKEFTLAQVLSITTGRLLCSMGEVYEILNHITGDNLYTHVLPRASRFASPILIDAFPCLDLSKDCIEGIDAEIKNAATPRDGCKKWMAGLNLPVSYQIASHGDSWLSLDPLGELSSMVGDKPAMAISKGKESP